VDYSRCRLWFDFVPKETDAWLASLTTAGTFVDAPAPPAGDMDTARSHSLLVESFGDRDVAAKALREVIWRTWSNSTGGLFYREMLLDLARSLVTVVPPVPDGDDEFVRDDRVVCVYVYVNVCMCCCICSWRSAALFRSRKSLIDGWLGTGERVADGDDFCRHRLVQGASCGENAGHAGRGVAAWSRAARTPHGDAVL
jgi:hypothetical protein